MRRRSTLGLLLALVACKATPTRERAGDAGHAVAETKAPDGGLPNPLAALPYLQVRGVSPADQTKSGLLVHDYERTDPSYRLHVDRFSEAVLLDTKGEVVWRWQIPSPDRQIRPGLIVGWGFAGLLDSGDLVVVDSFKRVLKLAPDSSVRWESDVAAHHNAYLAANGDIYVPTATVRMIDVGKEKRVILDDGIAVLDANGKVKKEMSEWNAFLRHPELGPRLRAELDRYAAREANGPTGKEWKERSDDVAAVLARGGPEVQRDARELLRNSAPVLPPNRPDGGVVEMLAMPWLGSFFHTNKVVPLDRDIPGLGKKGEVLVSNFVLTPLEIVRGLFVFDLAKGELKGRVLDGVLDGQHEPNVLGNGDVLVFDNRVKGPHSRVVEVNPATREIVWSYEAADLQVPSEGAVFPLPNGDVLVTDSVRGRVFEVTRGKDVVWDYFRPLSSGPPGGAPGGMAMRGALHSVLPVPASIAAKVLASRKP